MLASFANPLSRGFRNPRKPKPAPLNQEPGNGGNGGGAGGGGGGGAGSPSGGLIPGSPSAQRVTQKPLFLCKPFVTSQLVKGSFSTIVVLPRYVDQGEWLALNRTFPSSTRKYPPFSNPNPANDPVFLKADQVLFTQSLSSLIC